MGLCLNMNKEGKVLAIFDFRRKMSFFIELCNACSCNCNDSVIPKCGKKWYNIKGVNIFKLEYFDIILHRSVIMGL